jgi:hypothetical protein
LKQEGQQESKLSEGKKAIKQRGEHASQQEYKYYQQG